MEIIYDESRKHNPHFAYFNLVPKSLNETNLLQSPQARDEIINSYYVLLENLLKRHVHHSAVIVRVDYYGDGILALKYEIPRGIGNQY